MTEIITISEFFEPTANFYQLEGLESTEELTPHGFENNTQENIGIRILFSANELAKRYIQRITIEITHNKTSEEPREDPTSFSYLYRNAELYQVKTPNTSIRGLNSALNGLILPDASYEINAGDRKEGEVILWLSGAEPERHLSVVELFPESAVIRVSNNAGQSWNNNLQP